MSNCGTLSDCKNAGLCRAGGRDMELGSWTEARSQSCISALPTMGQRSNKSTLLISKEFPGFVADDRRK